MGWGWWMRSGCCVSGCGFRRPAAGGVADGHRDQVGGQTCRACSTVTPLTPGGSSDSRRPDAQGSFRRSSRQTRPATTGLSSSRTSSLTAPHKAVARKCMIAPPTTRTYGRQQGRVEAGSHRLVLGALQRQSRNAEVVRFGLARQLHLLGCDMPHHDAGTFADESRPASRPWPEVRALRFTGPPSAAAALSWSVTPDAAGGANAASRWAQDSAVGASSVCPLLMSAANCPIRRRWCGFPQPARCRRTLCSHRRSATDR